VVDIDRIKVNIGRNI